MASEPFLHFTLIGALVFAGHRWFTKSPELPTIEVSATKQRELVKLFEQRQKRAPNATERRELLGRYVEDEALFREGVRRSLIHTDPLLRGQIIARVRSALQSELESTSPTERELQRYHAEHRLDYATPETVSYREYWIQRGPEAGNEARRLLTALQKQEPPHGVEGFTFHDHSGRTKAQLTSLYDREIADTLWALPNASWNELRSERGIHVVRVHQHVPASDPPFPAIREQVASAYQKDQLARAFQAQLTELTSQWRVSVAKDP